MAIISLLAINNDGVVDSLLEKLLTLIKEQNFRVSVLVFKKNVVNQIVCAGYMRRKI